MAWHEYFDVHIAGRPWAFKALLDASIALMTVPEQMPQWFDPSFTPNPRWRPGQMPTINQQELQNLDL